jgi:hypothetical protein
MALLLSLVSPETAHATERKAMFALILGVNQSVDRELAPLRYADDDAAAYLDLFRHLGARTYLLMRADEGSKRIHPQAAAEARLPVRHELERAIAELAGEIANARAQGIATVFYLLYAGHGNAVNGEGYVTLEDARLDGRYLQALIERAAADESHAIVDACYSYYLTFGRGPGGRRRAVSRFAALEGLGARHSIGLLLSTSSARESHEWEAYQGGVFSHEVRSGLYGAADANGDGQISYREMAAFIERANAAVPNERYRPDVYARPSGHGELLMDLGAAMDRRLEIDGGAHGQYILEDDRGNRLADFHNGPGSDLRITRPLGNLYLRRVQDEVEFEIPGGEPIVKLAELSPTEPRTHPRGAAHVAFQALFTLPFDQQAVSEYVFRRAEPPPRWPVVRTAIGWTAVALACASLVSAIALSVDAQELLDRSRTPPNQATGASVNGALNQRYLGAGLLYGLGGALGLGGTLVLSLPGRRVLVAPGPGLGVSGSF